MTTYKIIKCPLNIPNGRKVFQMSRIYNNNFHSKVLQKVHKHIDILGLKRNHLATLAVSLCDFYRVQKLPQFLFIRGQCLFSQVNTQRKHNHACYDLPEHVLNLAHMYVHIMLYRLYIGRLTDLRFSKPI
jgi:hypothetical protein